MLQKLAYLKVSRYLYKELFDYKSEISMIRYTFTTLKDKYV